MKSFLIYTIVFLINSVQGNVSRPSCTLRSGGQGFCMPIKDCEMCKSETFTFFPDHFCPGDFSLICCDTSITSPNRGGDTTTKAPISPPLNIRNFENHPSYKLFDTENCGEIRPGIKIANGNEAEVLEFPWAALIGYEGLDGSLQFNCGGTLISGEFNLKVLYEFLLI